MRIAIYGGSFNPPHLGHVSAAETVAEEIKPDRLLLIPTNVAPHKEMAERSPSPEQRLDMCSLAFGHVEGAEVSDIELRRQGKSYSADTVSELMELYPGDELFLVVGSDMFLSFETWYRFQYLLESCTLLVLSREEDDRQQLEEYRRELEEKYSARIVMLSHEPLPMSSSEIRERLRLGLGLDMLPEAVYAEIIRCRYYDAQPELSWLRQQVEPMLSSQCLAHTAGCELEAVQLAMRWGENPESAAAAGILHDITKKLSLDEQLILCDKYGIILDNSQLENPSLIHAITGAELAGERFGISGEIKSAIRWHTTGRPDMTNLEKIIYLADYIEPNRDFEGLDKLRELAYEDLDAAMALALEMSLEDIRCRNIEPHRDSVEACIWYMSGENN